MKNTEFVTGKCRLSFPHVFEPVASVAFGGAPKYQTDVLIPKTDTETIQRLQQAFAAAVDQGAQTRWQGKTPVLDVTSVLKDGDLKSIEGYKGCWFVTAKSNQDHAPEIVDLRGNPIIQHSEIYGGVYARVLINLYPYNYNNMKQGIGVSLGAIQKLEDGEAFGGGTTSAASAFGSFAPVSDEQVPFATAPAINPITGLPM